MIRLFEYPQNVGKEEDNSTNQVKWDDFRFSLEDASTDKPYVWDKPVLSCDSPRKCIVVKRKVESTTNGIEYPVNHHRYHDFAKVIIVEVVLTLFIDIVHEDYGIIEWIWTT
jgi:hypothetical protein